MTDPGTYRGLVKTGRGGGVKEMSVPGTLDDIRRLTGLKVIPGTLNLDLTAPLDLKLLKYISFADLGWDFDPASQGIRFSGETGVYFRRAVIAGDYPSCVLSFTWVTDPYTDIEVISPLLLRTVLHLKDGDLVNFSLEYAVIGIRQIV
jgi:CTP-dependent riboflavin kinase